MQVKVGQCAILAALLEKIETGLAQSKANEVIPDEQLDKELPEWLR